MNELRASKAVIWFLLFIVDIPSLLFLQHTQAGLHHKIATESTSPPPNAIFKDIKPATVIAKMIANWGLEFGYFPH